ncbi:hypothetical protein N783_20050 [Pontibacillus marinus BH030004 = DSM 16465]|uniref:Uncharacterized protein n=1 Tax=Pontibacillus marinus BH030004 = DSM 16465 TaxID=1385511 RepID=A0A0A5GF79_9BACI|nr:hypothetical protein N783_20050 [Pontibacillus marinus BH030004 = DSM 16465]
MVIQVFFCDLRTGEVGVQALLYNLRVAAYGMRTLHLQKKEACSPLL